jgi:hypothetical protein
MHLNVAAKSRRYAGLNILEKSRRSEKYAKPKIPSLSFDKQTYPPTNQMRYIKPII